MPSLASLSRFGVLPAINPRWYAPMFHMPISSPMMTTMLGFLSSALALGVPITPNSVAAVAKTKLIFADHFIDILLFLFPATRKSKKRFFSGADARCSKAQCMLPLNAHPRKLVEVTMPICGDLPCRQRCQSTLDLPHG